MLVQALPTGQLWLCFPREKSCPTIDPRRVQNPPAKVDNGLWKASGRLFWESWAKLGRQGRSEAVFGRLWGRSWDAFGALGAVLGASWGVPGRSWAPLGGHVGTPAVLIWTIWALSVAQREIQQKPDIFRVFRLPGPPGGVRNRSKICPESF